MHLLVHAVQDRGKASMPAAYGYAMTIRRAQGCTLDLVGLHFNRRKPDRGYGYVAVSRAKRKVDTFIVDQVRRTDWLPVGGDVRGPDAEQVHPSAASESDDEYDRGSDESDSDRSSSCDDGRSAASSEVLENDLRTEGISSAPAVCEEADGLVD